MSAALYANLNNSVLAKPPAARGAGQAGLTAATTTTLTKATTVVNQVTTVQASHPAVITLPTTGLIVDRTVVTTLGK